MVKRAIITSHNECFVTTIGFSQHGFFGKGVSKLDDARYRFTTQGLLSQVA